MKFLILLSTIVIATRAMKINMNEALSLNALNDAASLAQLQDTDDTPPDVYEDLQIDKREKASVLWANLTTAQRKVLTDYKVKLLASTKDVTYPSVYKNLWLACKAANLTSYT